MMLFESAETEISIIDPYIEEETIRLLAWTHGSVELTFIGLKIGVEAINEAQNLRRSGRIIRLIRNSQAHDRWFRVDGRWWHSGGSLKDLGRKYTRIAKVDDPREILAHEKMLAHLVTNGTEVAR